MKYNFSNEHLALLLKHSSDAFNRWNAGNRLTMKVLLERVAEPKHAEVSNSLLTLNQALAHAMRLGNTDNSLLAELLILPNEKDLEEHVDVIDMQAIVLACESLQQAVAQHLEEDLLKAYHACQRTVEYQYNAQEMGRRRLQNACLQLLTALGRAEYLQLALQQFNQASNMTEQAGAINALLHQESEEREQALASFEQQWTHDSLVMDKWLAFHARSKIPDVLMKVKKLMQHPVFTLQNPNKVRALIGVFAGQNSYAFHDASGNGYEFIANQVIALDKLNPQVASRLVRTLIRWQKYAQPFKQNMYEQLEFIATQKNLSKDVHEIVSKSLLPIE
jgi:aminopeptidase N